MMPTLHYDPQKAEQALIAFEAVSTHCLNMVKRGPMAVEQIKGDIVRRKKDAEDPINIDVKDPMLAGAKAWERMIGPMAALTDGAKAAVPVGAKLEAAHNALFKKPTDRKTMETFAVSVKNASVMCGKLRALTLSFQQSLPRMYAGDDQTKIFLTLANTLLDHISACLPKLAPPRPLTGPPKH